MACEPTDERCAGPLRLLDLPDAQSKMGLLKHAVLPYFALFHTITVIWMLPAFRDHFAETAYKVTTDLSFVERHLLDAAAGFHAALAFACVTGVLKEDAHFRGIVVIMEVILWSFDWIGAMSIEELDATAMMVNTLVAVGGAAVHSMEPGIFTRDKDNEKKQR